MLPYKVLSMLKFVLPHTADQSVPGLPAEASTEGWTVPHIIKKVVDVDRLDALLAPMAESKLSKQPQKPLPTPEIEAEANPKKRAKTKKKAQKRKRDDELDGEEFTASVLGDDVLNAVNYTLEKVPVLQQKTSSVGYALDLGVLFALEGNLDAAGITPKISVWTKARKFIKSYLNRTHALRARCSDPDDPKDINDLGAGPGHDSKDASAGDVEAEEQEEDVYQRLGRVFRALNTSSLVTFVDNNFGDFGNLV